VKERGFLEKARFGNRSVFYPAGMIEHEDVHVLSLVGIPKARKVLMAIMAEPGSSQGDLARATGLEPQGIIWFTKKLIDAGLVSTLVDGKYKRYYVTKEIEDLAQAAYKRIQWFREHLIALLKEDGLQPRVLRSTPRMVSVQVRVGNRNIQLEFDSDPYNTVLVLLLAVIVAGVLVAAWKWSHPTKVIGGVKRGLTWLNPQPEPPGPAEGVLFCGKCSAQLFVGQKFCKDCGTSVK